MPGLLLLPESSAVLQAPPPPPHGLALKPCLTALACPGSPAPDLQLEHRNARRRNLSAAKALQGGKGGGKKGAAARKPKPRKRAPPSSAAVKQEQQEVAALHVAASPSSLQQQLAATGLDLPPGVTQALLAAAGSPAAMQIDEPLPTNLLPGLQLQQPLTWPWALGQPVQGGSGPMLGLSALPGAPTGSRLPLPPEVSVSVTQRLQGQAAALAPQQPAGGAAAASEVQLGSEFDSLIADLFGAGNGQQLLADMLLSAEQQQQLPAALPPAREPQLPMLPPPARHTQLPGPPPLLGILVPLAPGSAAADAAALIKQEPVFATPGAGLPLSAPLLGDPESQFPRVAAPDAPLPPAFQLGITPLQAQRAEEEAFAKLTAGEMEQQLQLLAEAQPAPQLPPPVSLQQALAMLQRQEQLEQAQQGDADQARARVAAGCAAAGPLPSSCSSVNCTAMPFTSAAGSLRAPVSQALLCHPQPAASGAAAGAPACGCCPLRMLCSATSLTSRCLALLSPHRPPACRCSRS